MSVRKVKTPAKLVTSNLNKLEAIITKTIDTVVGIVGASLGPGGRNIIIESQVYGMPNKNTKDGVTIFKSLGSNNAYEHLLIEQIRDVAIRTVNEAGDGTTTATIIAGSFIKNLFRFCKENPKFSPQRIARHIVKKVNEILIPEIEKGSILINKDNTDLLEKVANISVNGDVDMAKAVLEAFKLVGYGEGSHVTIQEHSGSPRYVTELIRGFPINKGYEESIGKFHTEFINDQAHQRCTLNDPLFILFDGRIGDLAQTQYIFDAIGQAYIGNPQQEIPPCPRFKNTVLVAHSFSEEVLNTLALNFKNQYTINILPLQTPISATMNSQLNFLMDLSAITGAKIFDLNNSLNSANFEDLGSGVEKIEMYRFRTTIIANPDELNIEARAHQLQQQILQSESTLETSLLEERLGKLTSGIAQLKIYGSSIGELKEKVDRAEDAVCAVKAAISKGCVPGGCRMFLNLFKAIDLSDPIDTSVIMPSLITPFYRLLENAGYNMEEIDTIHKHLLRNPDLVYDVYDGVYGNCIELGVLDATLAVTQALKNAASIASVMGTLGGIVCYERDVAHERQHARDDEEFDRYLVNSDNIINEANLRP